MPASKTEPADRSVLENDRRTPLCISSAEEEGTRIVNEAIKSAESKKREALLEVLLRFLGGEAGDALQHFGLAALDKLDFARREVDATIKAEGERVVFECGVRSLHPELVKMLGRLHYRFAAWTSTPSSAAIMPAMWLTSTEC